MDSETLKIVIFIGAVLAAAAVARSFFGGEARKDPNPTWPPPPPPVVPGVDKRSEEPEEEEENLTKTAVGADIPFPAAAKEAIRKLPPEERPKIVNYLFRKTDLVKGPPDPTDFIDEFLIQTVNDDGTLFTDSIVVATPAALARILREEKRHAIYAARYIIVDRFNVGEVLTGWLKSEGTAADRSSDEEVAHEKPVSP